MSHVLTDYLIEAGLGGQNNCRENKLGVVFGLDHRKMPARERRTIHVTLANVPGVRTHSVGDGDERRVMIEPDDA